MDQATYNEHAAAIQAGRVIVHEGRSAASLKELNWIAGVVTKGRAPLDLLDDKAAAAATDKSVKTDAPDSITVTKAEYEAALDMHTRPLQAENAALTTENGTLKTQVAALQADAGAMTEANTILTRNVEMLEQDKAALEKEIEDLHATIGTLEADKTALAEQAAGLQAQAIKAPTPEASPTEATDTPAPAIKAK